MTLVAGTKIGPYEVLAPLGAGGMGEVYRARDSKLNREVALKILPDLSASDADRLARFKREAQVLASLNHPNIGAIYGFEETADRQALVLELVEGETLAERIKRGRIPIKEALSLARQIAEALEAAHELSVTHRDLKPANIKLRPDGTVKVLDFGLAKLAQGSDTQIQSGPSASPTITRVAATEIGTIVGTAAYMSPEQARGMLVDKRTDIWAFGCVLYEMLTGRSAFAGATFADTIAATLDREPDWELLPTSTSTKIRDLLARCLQKNPQNRLRDIADARLEIEEARTTREAPLRIGMSSVVGAVAVVLTVVAAAWRYGSTTTPPAPHEPVSVLISDFHNSTGDSTFDLTLEPILKLALESTSFISAYDRSAIARSLGVRPPATLDERAALEIAVKQGVAIVVSGSINREGSRFGLSIKATRAVTGAVVASANETAPEKAQVLAVTTRLATVVRDALGDETSDSAQRFAMETLSATSLDVVREYAMAMDALSRGKFDEALQSFKNSVALDGNFGLAYAGMAIASRNLDRQQEAEKHIKEAIRHLDGMTERERYRTRGLFFYLTNDYGACVREYADLVGRFSADAAARNNLALCLTYLRDLPRAVNEMREVVKILPNRALYRVNLSLYASYSGDFQTGEKEARSTLGQSPWALQALALAQTGQGLVSEAAASYEGLGKVENAGPSYTASGLGDLALYEGRFSDAARLLEAGATADLKTNDIDRAASKFVALAYANLSRRQSAAALSAAERALAHSQVIKIRFLAARVFAEAGSAAKASALSTGLASELQAEPQAYAKIVDGVTAMKSGDPRQAIKSLTEAIALMDTWIGHFELGRAYLEAGAFTQADSEFDRCIRRRGEALALFLDEEPTYGYFPSVYYYQGRAREQLKTQGFADSYREYLQIRGRSTEDPIAQQLRQAGS